MLVSWIEPAARLEDGLDFFFFFFKRQATKTILNAKAITTGVAMVFCLLFFDFDMDLWIFLNIASLTS